MTKDTTANNSGSAPHRQVNIAADASGVTAEHKATAAKHMANVTDQCSATGNACKKPGC